MNIYNIVNWLEKNSCPPEVTHIFRSLSLIKKDDIAYRPDSWLFGCFFWSLVIIILFISWWIATTTEIKENLVLGTLTALAILAGFLINLMLYTGNAGNLKSLNYKTSKEIAYSLRSMLRFQLKTFLFYLFAILYGLLWFIVEDYIAKIIIETLMLASIISSILFSMLLPFQLYEIHDFLLIEAVKKKEKEYKDECDEIMKNVRKNSS